MKKIFFYVHSEKQLKNKIFFPDKNDYANSDQRLLFFLDLKKNFEKREYNLCTQDINSVEASEFGIYQTIPEDIKAIKPNSFLFLMESKTVTTQDWSYDKHKYFKKIFTYKNIDQKKYIQVFHSYTFKIPIKSQPKLNNKIVMICSNKRSTSYNQLYTFRYKLIKYMIKKNKKNFDLFGVGWTNFPVYVNPRVNINFNRIYDFIVKKISLLFNLKFSVKPVYKGTIKDKNKILQEYDFSICIENTNEDDFITSIIFESIINSCIPIYKGAKNINNYVPSDCFIDLNKFGSLKELIETINKFDRDTINLYKKKMYNYIINNKHEKFTSEYSIKKIIKNILE